VPDPSKIPLWSANRGVQMMVRVALAQERLDPVPVTGLDELRRAAEDLRPRAVLVGADDLRAAGLDAPALVRAAGDVPVVIVGTARPGEATSGAVFLPLPFTSRDLLAVLGSPRSAPAPAPTAAPAPSPGPRPAAPAAAQPDAAQLADLVREEVRRLVEETARRVVEEAARRIVPELAESLIKQELARLLREAEDAALADHPNED
jgi:hypothetical protein